MAALCQQRRALVEIPAPQPKMAGKPDWYTQQVFGEVLKPTQLCYKLVCYYANLTMMLCNTFIDICYFYWVFSCVCVCKKQNILHIFQNHNLNT